MLLWTTMCVAGLLAAWLLVRTRDADRPRIPHYLALFFSMGVACVGGYAFLLRAVLSGRHIDRSLLLGSIIFIIAALFVAAVCLKNQAWRQVAGIAGTFLLGAVLLTVAALALILLALRGPQPPSLQKLQSKFPQRRSQLESLAALEAPPGIRSPKSIEEIRRERQLAAAEPPQPSPSLIRSFLNLLYSHDTAAPRVVYQNDAILFVYGNQNGPLIGGGRGPSWGYLYCPDSPDGNPASVCQDAAIHSGADWGPRTLLSLRLDQHWFAYSRGPSS